ncbi:MAG TPA: glycosyl transferase family 1 [Caulobacteraceae bacterium]|nr:glycosyl transferase family 1 [Caulobacteraceae bacterium]
MAGLRLAYFVHDVSDPAVAKRVRMMRAGEADVTVVGFRRSDIPVAEVEGARVIDLGRTYDARFAHRALAVARRLLQTGARQRALGKIDVFLARNLEMLVLAEAARKSQRTQAGLVYECLDVHRLMVGEGPVGIGLRALEKRLLRRVGLLIVSSTAFLSSYFEPRQGVGRDLPVPVMMVENKVFPPIPANENVALRPAHRPWKIGWFGAIRCRRSMEILCDLACRRPDLVEVVIRGRASEAEFEDLPALLADLPNVSFEGPYAAEDLAEIYSQVHFTWAIDYFEAGANSDWLLPNRIYEGGLHGAVPMALADVETGAWLAERELGLLMTDPATELEAMLEAMTPESYVELAGRSLAAPRSLFVADAEDCARLTTALASAA